MLLELLMYDLPPRPINLIISCQERLSILVAQFTPNTYTTRVIIQNLFKLLPQSLFCHPDKK